MEFLLLLFECREQASVPAFIFSRVPCLCLFCSAATFYFYDGFARGLSFATGQSAPGQKPALLECVFVCFTFFGCFCFLFVPFRMRWLVQKTFLTLNVYKYVAVALHVVRFERRGFVSVNLRGNRACLFSFAAPYTVCRIVLVLLSHVHS